MAETPLCAYARAKEAGLTAGVKLTMTVLYKYTPSSQLRAWLEGQRTSPPFTFVAVALLVDVTGRSRSLVYDDLKALEQAGVLVSAKRTIEGRERDGWVLPLRDEVEPAGLEDGQQRRSESGPPDTSPAKDVRPAGQTDLSDPPDVRPAGRRGPAGRTDQSGPPDADVRPAGRELVF